MKRLVYILFLLFFTRTSIVAQMAPDLSCIETGNNGAVTLRWTQSAIDTDLQGYIIFYSSNGTSFNSIDTVQPTLFAYTHPDANADLGSRWYYVQAYYDSGIADSDTLQSIYLQVDNNQPDYDQADLYWNAMRDPLPAGTSGKYKILREHPVGNWKIYDSVSVSQLSWSEPVHVCYDSITYRIIIENEKGCSSVSNPRGALFKDVGYPLEPIFDSVSISVNGIAELGWSPSESPDVTGYIIYRLENGNWPEIKRVMGRDNTFYADSLVDPCSESYYYAIAAIDSCANKSPGTFASPRNTILLDDVKNNVCEGTNTLTWTAYQNSEPGLDYYQVYYKTDEGQFVLAGQVDAGQLSFVHESVQPGFVYSYYVRAVAGEITSSSCVRQVYPLSYTVPKFVYFANADVLPSGQVALTIDVDTTPDYCTWNIYREEPPSYSPTLIAGIDKNGSASSPLSYLDSTADAGTGPYYYYVDVLDSCRKTSLSSNSNKTIHLTVVNKGGNVNQLQWNAFEGWDAGVDKYYIYRMINGQEPDNPIDSVPYSVMEYNDDLSSLGDGTGQTIYWVQAYENPGNEFGFREKANSNRVMASLSSDMYMPTAFRPGGYTPVYKPVYRFYSGEEFLLQIYNRWGQLLYETNDPEQGWDGNFNGKTVENGTYVYKLFYRKKEQESTSETGVFTVVR